jgi:hypothetical protein
MQLGHPAMADHGHLESDQEGRVAQLHLPRNFSSLVITRSILLSYPRTEELCCIVGCIGTCQTIPHRLYQAVLAVRTPSNITSGTQQSFKAPDND